MLILPNLLLHNSLSAMARRPTALLNQLIRRRRRRPVSAADGKGILYALKQGTTPSGNWIVKLGMTTNFPRRLREHERDCPTNNRVVLLTHKVAFWRRKGTPISYSPAPRATGSYRVASAPSCGKDLHR